MPSYKIDCLIRHPEGEQEQLLEDAVQTALYEAGVSGVTGITAYQVFPNGG